MNDQKSKRDEVRARNKKARAPHQAETKYSDDGANKPGLATRRTAHRLLGAIIETNTSFDALTDDAHGHPHYLALDRRDRALLRAILMVALRFRAELSDVLDSFIDKPLPAGATALQTVLHVALAQILFLDVPDHSAVDLAVESANRDPRLKRFASLVNAVTRRAVRSKQKVLDKIAQATPRSSPWFSERLIEIYGAEKAAEIEAMHRIEAPLDFTVKNAGEAEKWAEALEAALLPFGTLRRPHGDADITQLAGFDEGAWWVQDAAAALPAKLFGDLNGKRALDLCAAPGGKTAQLAAAGAKVTALDMSANRLKRLDENLARLGLNENCQTVVSSLFDFAPEELFDAVLLDAPCSSTGTVRRHPDVPWTKTPEDITKLAELQARMLTKAAQFVALDGVLIFSNCSLDPLEGEDVARVFADADNGFDVVPVEAAAITGLETCLTPEGFVRTTPADFNREGNFDGSGLDGFFAAVFKRRG
ncbi:RsmB/NOP family class I SAM-dependent RNA methyltransferase [Ahrensia sp. 13_GOM-1096m]|uniref:RsmB/NOP family class I SAM-dependent RNA methyltransferase n=1 Tax=Ahrensia sp. 13_GOM-1096m TaxID=1380380 RepID=UPI00047E484A|nr:RsmB/NOP family class I SAM-dependent RNA methyltransferase [Ahrensia sp. 13_GOM-1096m]